MQSYNPDQYYNDYIPAIEKTSQPLVNWSSLVDIIIGFAIVLMMIIAAGIL